MNYMKTVFISYSKCDKVKAVEIKDMLEKNTIQTKIDLKEIKAGQDFENGINIMLKNSDYTVFLVSKNSLRSTWCLYEFEKTVSIENQLFTNRFIAVHLDNFFKKPNANEEITKFFDKEIAKLKRTIISVKDLNNNTADLDCDYTRYIMMRTQIGNVLHRLKTCKVLDFSSAEKIDENINELISAITSQRKTTKKISEKIKSNTERDKELFKEIKQKLPYEQSIRYVEEHNFAGFAYNRNKLDDFDEFMYKCDDPEFFFIDEELESIRLNLKQNITEFIDLLDQNSFPIIESRTSIPPEWEFDQPERFSQCIKEIRLRKINIKKFYAELIKLCTKKLL